MKTFFVICAFVVLLIFPYRGYSQDLCQAAMKGDLDRVKKIIEANPQWLSIDCSGTPPLCIASGEGYTEIVQYLIKHGVDVNVVDPNGYTPLAYAAQRNKRGSAECAGVLLRNGALVDKTNQKGWTPLIMAAVYSNVSLLDTLLAHRAMIDYKEKTKGFSALHFAVKSGNKECVRGLLKKGADVDVKTLDGLTPIMMADANELTDIVELLMQKGATLPKK